MNLRPRGMSGRNGSGTQCVLAPRRGALLIMALICLAIASLLTAALIQAMILSQRQLVIEEDRVQAEWLARSALGHAWNRLQRQSSLSPETWNLTSKDLDAQAAATINIEVRNDAADAATRVITVYVEYAPVASRVIRATRTARWRSAADQTLIPKEP